MAASIRQHILTELLARLAHITTEAGYQTDAGRTIFFGETPQLGPDDPDEAIAVVVRDDIPTDLGGISDPTGVIVSVLPLDVQAVVKADQEQPWVSVEQIIADIKRAVETSDRSLGGLLTRDLLRGRTRALVREPGSTVVGAGLEYRACFAESWGGGEA